MKKTACLIIHESLWKPKSLFFHPFPVIQMWSHLECCSLNTSSEHVQMSQVHTSCLRLQTQPVNLVMSQHAMWRGVHLQPAAVWTTMSDHVTAAQNQFVGL